MKNSAWFGARSRYWRERDRGGRERQEERQRGRETEICCDVEKGEVL